MLRLNDKNWLVKDVVFLLSSLMLTPDSPAVTIPRKYLNQPVSNNILWAREWHIYQLEITKILTRHQSVHLLVSNRCYMPSLWYLIGLARFRCISWSIIETQSRAVLVKWNPRTTINGLGNNNYAICVLGNTNRAICVVNILISQFNFVSLQSHLFSSLECWLVQEYFHSYRN
jgi:hypothetical protein